MTVAIETASCPVCSSPAKTQRQVPYGRLMKCQACNHAFCVYSGDESHQQANEKFSAEEHYSFEQSEDLDLLARERLKDISIHLEPHASILEIGCSYGEFLRAAQREGYRAAGLDLYPHLPADAASLGIEVIRMRVEDYVPEQPYDCVAGFHVLEHLADPATLLRRMASWVLPNGIAYFEVPNAYSLNAFLQGPRWWGYTADHAQYFSAQSLTRLLSRVGFRVEAVYGSVSWYDPCYPYSAIRRRIIRPGASDSLRKVSADVKAARLLDPLSRTPLRKLGWSPNLRCIARRVSTS